MTSPLNILIISPKIPYPLDEGGKIVIFNTAKYLALRGHKITMLAIGSNSAMDTSEPEKYCRLEVVRKDTKNRVAGALKNLFTSVPYNMAKYQDAAVKEKLKDMLRRERFDIVQVENLHMAFYGEFIKKEFNIPVILREHNIETTIMERFYKNQKNTLIKLYAYLQYKKLYAYESNVCHIFDRCITISNTDSERLKKMNKNVSVSTIMAGVDTDYLYPMEDREEPFSIVHVGSMSWLPNVEAILWFCDKVLPIVKREFPVMKFYIVGGNPPEKIKRLADKNIIVTGYVNDPREFIAKGQVYVIPLLSGGGIRIKILEALAMKKALVSTSVGCEGIGLEDGKHILVSETPDGFAGKVLELLRSPEKRARIATAGYHLIQDKFLWPGIAEEFEREYLQVIKG